MKIKVKKESPLLCFIAVIAFIFFLWISYPVLIGEDDFRFYADSMFYMDFSEKYEQYIKNGYYLIGGGGNLLGPFFIYKMLFGSIFLILLFNILSYFWFVKLTLRLTNARRFYFTLILFLSPISFLSLQSLNKEVISILAFGFFFIAVEKKSSVIFILSIFFALLTRWQLCLVFIIFSLMYTKYNPLCRFKKSQIVILLFAISIVYPFVSSGFTEVNSAIDGAKEELGGGGIYFFLLSIQDKPLGYLIVFPFKLAHLLFGMATNISFAFKLNDFYITTGLFYQAWLNIFIFSLLAFKIYKNKYLFNSPIFVLMIVYSLVFCLTPIYNIRYLYPLYIMAIMLLCSKQSLKHQFWLNG